MGGSRYGWGVGCLLAIVAGVACRSPRPQWAFSTDAVFDASTVPAYAHRHDDVYARIDADLDDHLAHLQRWVRQRSISALDEGIDAMAQLLADDLRAIGFNQVELVQTPGHPGVLAHYDAGALRTLVDYMMYDVQPVEPNWRIDDPFAGELVDHELGSVLMARGATNQKGPQRAFLNAVDAMLSTRGTLPVNLYVVAQGEEALGSPNFGAVFAPWQERLRQADGAFFPMNIQAADGRVALNLGVKGLVYFELDSRLPPGLEPDAADRMIRAHLDAGGFHDIEMRPLAGYPAAATGVDTPPVQAAIGVFNGYGATPRVSPWLAGSAPFHRFTRTLGLPFVFGGLGHGSGAHAPDEYMLIHPAAGVRAAGLADIEKSYVDLLHVFADIPTP